MRRAALMLLGVAVGLVLLLAQVPTPAASPLPTGTVSVGTRLDRVIVDENGDLIVGEGLTSIDPIGWASSGVFEAADIVGGEVVTFSAGPHAVTLDDDGSVVWAGDGIGISPPPPSAGATIDPDDVTDGTYHPCEDLEQVVRELAGEVRALRESVEALSPTTARVVVIAGD